jgi:hypothetical protein
LNTHNTPEHARHTRPRRRVDHAPPQQPVDERALSNVGEADHAAAHSSRRQPAPRALRVDVARQLQRRSPQRVDASARLAVCPKHLLRQLRRRQLLLHVLLRHTSRLLLLCVLVTRLLGCLACCARRLARRRLVRRRALCCCCPHGLCCVVDVPGLLVCSADHVLAVEYHQPRLAPDPLAHLLLLCVAWVCRQVQRML